MRECFEIVTEEGLSFFVYKVVPAENTTKWTSHRANIKQFVNIFRNTCYKILEARTINSMESIWCNNMLVYLSLDIICSSRLTVYHKHPSQKTVRILELVIRRQISVHIFAPNGGYCWIPVGKAAFEHSDASIFILEGYHDYFRTLTPSLPPDPQRWYACNVAIDGYTIESLTLS